MDTAPRSLWLAYSGGLDSQVLLHLLHSAQTQFAPLQLRAVHVHHGLNSKANNWAEHCLQSCQHLSIPCKIIRVQIPQDTGESLEALARTVRYQAFKDLLQTNEALLTAQHADDQAETVLLQLLRGAGAPGLAAMPEKSRLGKGWLLRPLLGFRRADLFAYAQQHRLTWVEDDSNQDRRFDRNFLRHEILPLLENRWPATVKTLGTAARYQADNVELLRDLGKLDLQQCLHNTPLNIAALQTFSLARQNNVLRTWLGQQGFKLPPAHKLQQIHQTLIQARVDGQPCVNWQSVEIRRFRGALYAMSPLPSVPQGFSAVWQEVQAPVLPLGHLHVIQGGTLRWPLQNLSVRLRQGGETCTLNGKTQALKKLLQTSSLPTWLRAFLPLLFQGKTLVAVPGIAVCDEFRVNNGVHLEWDTS